MFGRTKTQAVKDHAATSKEFALALSRDKKFRKQLLSAIGHGAKAKRRAAKRVGFLAAATRLANDKQLRRELRDDDQEPRSTPGAASSEAEAQPQAPQHDARARRRRGRGRRCAQAPRPHAGANSANGTGISTIDESIEVDVPVSTAYNQWTQFEEFPLFMEGVDDVQQRDDTRLHWVATIGGHTAEWDAKILEQHPDKQISWISEDGKKTRGTVSFEPIGESKTLIRLSMSYQAEGPVEQLGSAAGLDAKRVRGDLKRFKEPDREPRHRERRVARRDRRRQDREQDQGLSFTASRLAPRGAAPMAQSFCPADRLAELGSDQVGELGDDHVGG